MGVSGISTATAVTAGIDHTCALLVDNSVKCWGSNGSGQLGDGTTSRRLTPVSVSGISTATAVTAGIFHTCALLADNSVKCWGENGLGQLGDGTSTDNLTAVSVSGISTATAVTAARYFHTCALLADNSVKCWGRNMDGQLGDGTTTTRLTPVTVQF